MYGLLKSVLLSILQDHEDREVQKSRKYTLFKTLTIHLQHLQVYVYV